MCKERNWYWMASPDQGKGEMWKWADQEKADEIRFEKLDANDNSMRNKDSFEACRPNDMLFLYESGVGSEELCRDRKSEIGGRPVYVR